MIGYSGWLPKMTVRDVWKIGALRHDAVSTIATIVAIETILLLGI